VTRREEEASPIEALGMVGGAWSIIVHGGAGDVAASEIESRLAVCAHAAKEGAAILARGGSAIDAAQRAVEILEDHPDFNAGTGACLTSDGTIELDASIMEGADLRGGGVAALSPFLHPIAIARAVLEEGAHVLYAGEGAKNFAIARGYVPSSNEAMTTEAAREKWKKLRDDHDARDRSTNGGTVGAVARDRDGHLAAATSTGGRAFKKPGRVGDSPILGAGTYADDQAGACSNTGDGEAVLRLALAKTAIESMRSGHSAEDAARTSITLMRDRLNANGGMITIDQRGTIGLARSTRSMPWSAHASDWPSPRSGS
jgi:beta-aspartyl-peptidase (threonine type)